MTYQSLYRKYRPSKLDEVVGQKHVVHVLRNSITKDKISHAYLFCGPRGTGKTSMAKLFARAVNCENPEQIICGGCPNCVAVAEGTHPDLIEIDAASNNGVDEIRSLIEKVKYAPLLGKYKVYIIDEVHMLSQGAFNALLKTLEEPPAHVVFILATTEIHKVLPTIISRCQRYDFTRISDEDISGHLDSILRKEDVKAEQGVTEIIASLSGGGLRNALTILEQAIVLADDEITVQQIYETNGIVDSKTKTDMFKYIQNQDMESLTKQIHHISALSVGYDRLIMDFIQGIKDSVVYSHTSNKKYINENEFIFIEYLSQSLSIEDRLQIIDILLKYAEKMKFSQNQSTYFEVAIIEVFSIFNQLKSINSDIDRIVKGIDTQYVDLKSPSELVDTNLKESQIKDKKAHVEDEPSSTNELINSSYDEAAIIDDFPDESFEESNQLLPKDDIQSATHVKAEVSEKNTMSRKLDMLNIVRLMVTANKELRLEDEVRYEKITHYRTDLSWARVSSLIEKGKVVLSGEFFVVVIMSSDIQVREISERHHDIELLKFSEKLFGSKRIIYAITEEQFSEAVSEFRKRSSDNTLPEPIECPSFEEEEQEIIQEEKDESLDKVIELFGDSIELVD